MRSAYFFFLCYPELLSGYNFANIVSNIGNQFANSRLSALEAENWRMTVFVNFDLPTAGRIILYLYKNGGEFKRLLDVTPSSGFFGVNINCEASVISGDYLEIYTFIYPPNAKIYGDVTLNACWWEGNRIG